MNTANSIPTIVAIGLVLAIAAPGAAHGQSNYSESDLIAVLASDAPKAEKAITCKRLAVHGTDAAVPELAKLLSDQELTSWARIALEAIPHPAADEALREALSSLEGRPLIGVINSVGVGKDAGAVDGLVPHLQSDESDIVAAAAIALGHIGNEEARNALQSKLDDAGENVISVVAEGCILAAEQLLESGDAEAAASLYSQVNEANVSEQRKREATRGLIHAKKSIPLLTQQLQSTDKQRFGLGLGTAREMPGAEVTEALVSTLENANPVRQSLIVLSLAERDAESVLPSILRVAKSGSSGVRTSAMQVLGRIGDVTCVPTLLDAATDGDASVAQAAKDALASLSGNEIDSEIVEKLSSAKGSTRQVLLETIGQRRIDATSQLVEAANDSDKRIRSAALTALGATVGPENLSLLVDRVTNRKYELDNEVALRALRTAAVRMPDRDACAAELTDAMKDASQKDKTAIIAILGQVGGETALQSVAAAARSKNDAVADAASQALGKWMTPDAAPVLLNLAKSQTSKKYAIRALRGYLRIARQMKLTSAQRAEMCRNALETAIRDEERLLALQVLEIHASPDTLAVASAAQKIPSIKEEASKTVIKIAQKIGANLDDLTSVFKNGQISPVEIEVVRATYGAGEKSKDVTAILKKSVGKLPIVSLASPSYNASFGGDPAPGTVKQLVVQYKMNGRDGRATFDENSMIILPMPNAAQ